MLRLTLQTDGGSRGNPGPAAYGYVLRDVTGDIIASEGKAIGTATNNRAEYLGLIEGLKRAHNLGAQELIVEADSELVIKQMTGLYRIKHPDMRTLATEAQGHARFFERVTYKHIRREQNEAADALVNEALDAAGFPKAPPDPSRWRH